MSEELVKKIASSKILLDVLMDFEDFLDKNDIYVFENWNLGQIASGPKIDRYWVTVILKYPMAFKPDFEGAKRLESKGANIEYYKKYEEIYYNNLKPVDTINTTGLGYTRNSLMNTKEKPTLNEVCLVKVKLPKRFFPSLAESD